MPVTDAAARRGAAAARLEPEELQGRAQDQEGRRRRPADHRFRRPRRRRGIRRRQGRRRAAGDRLGPLHPRLRGAARPALKAGDSKTIKVTFPADYPAEDLKGKDAEFDVTVHKVQVEGESKIDEDFAKSLGLDSLAKLKELMKVQLEQETAGLTRTQMKRQLLDKLAADHDFEVPETMVEAEFEQIWQQLEAEIAKEDDPAAGAQGDRGREGRLPPHRRAPRAPRPAAVRDRPGQRRRGHRAGNGHADPAGRAAVPRPRTASGSSSTSATTRWRRPSCAPRSTRTRWSISCSTRPR